MKDIQTSFLTEPEIIKLTRGPKPEIKKIVIQVQEPDVTEKETKNDPAEEIVKSKAPDWVKNQGIEMKPPTEPYSSPREKY